MMSLVKKYNLYLIRNIVAMLAVFSFCAFGIAILLNFGRLSIRLLPYGVSYYQVCKLSFYLSPIMIFHFIPYILFGGLATGLIGLVNNNELISLKIFGLSHRKLAVSLGVIAVACVILISILTFAFPQSFAKFYKMRDEYKAASFFTIIKPKYMTNVHDNIIYFTGFDSNHAMKNLLIISGSNDSRRVLSAKTARIGYNATHELVLRCKDAALYMFSNNQGKVGTFDELEMLYTDATASGEKADFNLSLTTNQKVMTNQTLFNACFIEHSSSCTKDWLVEVHNRIYSIMLPLIIFTVCGITIISRHVRRCVTIFDDIWLVSFFAIIVLIKLFLIDFFTRINASYMIYVISFILCVVSLHKLYLIDKRV